MAEAVPDDRTPPDADELDFYGSFRVRFAASEDSTEIADRFSRTGVSKGIRWGSQWRFRGFGRIEFGFNMVNNNPVFVTGGDPGFSVGQGGQAIGTRLGYVGLDTPFGTVSFGKQWGVYSDVSGFTDQFATYGGDASGTYNAGTDGGISGTGRAETAMQYRNKFGPVAIGLQAQFRSRTDAARRFADSVGASVVTDVLPHFNGGVAINYVRDGVDQPEPNQPKRGDTAAVVGARYLRQPLTLAITYNRSENHEVDDLGRYFDASGTEFYAQYDFTQRWYSLGRVQPLAPARRHGRRLQAGVLPRRSGVSVAGRSRRPDRSEVRGQQAFRRFPERKDRRHDRNERGVVEGRGEGREVALIPGPQMSATSRPSPRPSAPISFPALASRARRTSAGPGLRRPPGRRPRRPEREARRRCRA